ncbi:MAG TPA: DNA ligase D [Pirellulales bacterium]|nr:DNA ligase D [Pirellulales bacterium]
MPLAEYRRKRHFKETPEPKGKVHRRKAGALSFVVQKHDATRLHYDFRLELDGVLKSWAVPKGPSYDPREKRLAVEVEDHPLEYGDFEGTIPEGEYGGGTVAVWDHGTWEAEGDASEGYRRGKLKFHLDGQKLKGGWTLVRMQRRPGERATNWLLIKERDETARPLEEYDVTEAEPASVTTGRTLAEIARDNDRVWTSNGSAKSKQAPAKRAVRARAKTIKKAATAKKPTKKGARAKKSSRRSSKKQAHDELPGKRAKMPQSVDLQLATLVKKPPEGPQWRHEIKFDGYRILCRLEGGKVRLITRGDQDWTSKMTTIAAAAAELPAESAILDGEVVALLPNGLSSFQALQNAFQANRQRELVYFAFDLVYLDGHDLRSAPLETRKAVLAELLGHNTSHGVIRYAEDIDGDGEKFFAEACRMGLEGIISKRRDRPYLGGRGYDWVKIKCVRREEFVIGGFTDPEGARHGLGALLVGYHQGDGGLVYAGKVGTGFNDRLLVELRKRLNGLAQHESPFVDFPARLKPRKAHWVKPQLVGQVEFSSWTDDGRLRHPSFQGLREDKPAASITRDRAQDLPNMAKNSKAASANGSAKRAKASDHKKGNKAQRAASEIESNSVAGVRLTHPDRLLYPEQGVTKLGLADFYAEIADWILPHVVGRPLSLLRCPEGRRKTCFFQKHLDASAPDVFDRVAIQEKNKVGQYPVVHDLAGIVALVQMGVLEIHLWGSRADNVEKPDRIVFDLDPEEGMDWRRVVDAAERVRDVLHSLDLESFVKTSGGKGLHVVVPIVRRHEWPEIKAFSKGVAQRIADESPERYTTNPLKARRVGRIFIDYLRNERGATSVAAYSTRARQGAPVSVPVEWDELKTDLRADHFNVENLPARLNQLKRDPWVELQTIHQNLTASALKAVTKSRR